MNKLIYLLLVIFFFCSCGDDQPLDLEPLFFSCNEEGQPFDFESYDGLITECTSVISIEDFNSSGEEWERNENEYKRTIEEGQLTQTSLNNTNWFFFNDVVLPDNLTNYQIDFELDLLNGIDTYFHVITWGGEDRLENYYSMGINGSNAFRVGTVINSQSFKELFYLPISAAITPGKNQLTIRVVDTQCYFFINQELVTSMELFLYGNEIGFNIPALSTNTIDNVTITQYFVD